MAKRPTSTDSDTSEAGAETFTAPEVIASTDIAPVEPVPSVPAVRSDAAPIKPGVRKITLAQARAHHANQPPRQS